MRAKSLNLVWIVVKDFKKAIKFYTEVVGLKLINSSEEWGWAELEAAEGGIRLGIGRYQPECQDFVGPGQNSVMTFTVANIDKARKEMQKDGATLVGDVEIVPGHVKLQTIKDVEGNFFQLVEEIPQGSYDSHHDHKHTGSCCH